MLRRGFYTRKKQPFFMVPQRSAFQGLYCFVMELCSNGSLPLGGWKMWPNGRTGSRLNIFWIWNSWPTLTAASWYQIAIDQPIFFFGIDQTWCNEVAGNLDGIHHSLFLVSWFGISILGEILKLGRSEKLFVYHFFFENPETSNIGANLWCLPLVR